ncbi:hypothetical protein JWG42_10420 [Desulfoprunum benzoelyticum]|uniref:DUF4145 domain-containing protein n=1 Tax=Desulfoprunum benzoelyticum TaxID=1506996 RepID=A0A840UTE8_9BACT|nr:hypothetical protein [Desulfoprunum benzoelyticum]MBB5349072.1 hypothetical protein [Desulfoprunum benzoelyticum]MBM9530561.1 hypothetical protein [Desulfoprunum benzoelyticum]
MTEDERWTHLVALDDELLKRGVLLPEWCTFIVRDVDMAFAAGGYLAAILTAVSGIETYLRSEYSITRKERLAELIDQAEIDANLKADLHALRKYRNKWVHVDNPWEDEELPEHSDMIEGELEEIAIFAVRALRRTIYKNQWV